MARGLGRPADDDRLGPGPPGRANLGRVAARVSGVLGDEIARLGKAQHGKVHFFVKGALHGQDALGPEAALTADRQRAFQGQHPGIQPGPEAFVRAKGRKLLAAGGEQNGSLGVFQVFRAGGAVRKVDPVLNPGGAGAKQAQVVRARLPAGGKKVFADLVRVGMGGIHHRVEAVGLQKFPHLVLIHAPGVQGQIRPGID